MFVHGVGEDSPEVFGTQMKGNFEEAGLDTSSWTEINWHATVQPGLVPDLTFSGKADQSVNYRQINGLMRGALGAATMLHPESPRFVKRVSKFLLWLSGLLPIVFLILSLIHISEPTRPY